ncbi:MAG: hypothetical protein WA484_01340, partial [Solirubrobacteraceae bacterium]
MSDTPTPARPTPGAPRVAGTGEQPVRIGVVGLGYWGPNLARNFAAIDGCELSWLCDDSEPARAALAGA